MWQFLAVAAVSGSTAFFATHLRAAVTERKRVQECGEERLVSGLDVAEVRDELRRGLESSVDFVETPLSNPTPLQSPLVKEGGIFRFSSGIGNGSRPGARNLRKKGGVRSGKGVGSEKNLGSFGGGAEHRKVSRRFSVCLKRRRTAKNSAADKHGSCPSEGGSSFFGWGLGVGMMYMMSAGKSEIHKLNTAMDETAKAIEELKTDLTRRQSISSAQITRSADEIEINTQKSSSEHTPPEPDELNSGNRKHNDIKLSSFSAVDDVECPSSVLTEEHEPELLELDQLEAEFVSELQKLPWCSAEASQPDSMRQSFPEFDAVKDRQNEMGHKVSDPCQFRGVEPSELDKKLSHLVIERQESQIIELETELQTAQLKLNAKEAELQALKDCVRHMTELSLSTIADDESDSHEGVGCTDMGGSESNKRAVVGMKRSIDSEFCDY